MKKTVRFLLLLPAVLFIYHVFFARHQHAAVSTEKWQDYEYRILDNGTAEITKYSGSETELIIPSAAGGYRVTSIGGKAFGWCSSLVAVIIPGSITTIGSHAFWHCGSLTLVIIPDSVTFIDSFAFGDCSSLASVTLPDSLTSISDYAFSGSDQLVLTADLGSYAEKYAADNKIKYKYPSD